MRQVFLRPGETGYSAAECRSLPGCVSQGRMRGKAVPMIRKAIEGYVLALPEDGLAVPPANFEALLRAV